MSAMMSSASSCTDTSSCLAMALVRRPVIFLQTLAARAEPEGRGEGLSTRQPGRTRVLQRPMDEMSLSCSLSDSMLVHSVSTIVSTWYSFTLLTSGPKLSETNAPTVKHNQTDWRTRAMSHRWVLPFDRQVLDLSVLVFQQLEDHPHHLSINTSSISRRTGTGRTGWYRFTRTFLSLSSSSLMESFCSSVIRSLVAMNLPTNTSRLY
ncbi:hypothetical protein EYF80_049732 [Liparis tanakae]|uniref:Uncharacterized protein n=1 Tax=Liparis tanakae TaxID=230148 RepID=A0A4Z2FFV2_9TELE|nr:hypothetical protein EYF80_049732 [Liparis tanakae]